MTVVISRRNKYCNKLAVTLADRFVFTCESWGECQLITVPVIKDPKVTKWRMDAGADWLQNRSSYETSEKCFTLTLSTLCRSVGGSFQELYGIWTVQVMLCSENM